MFCGSRHLYQNSNLFMYKNAIKPLFDFLVAGLLLFLLLPVFIVITILLFFNNKGNPFFVQKRPGMLLSDYQRLTFIGKVVRKTSLDELPQLINVLKGEMSLIGPRPLLPEYLELYNDEQKKRHFLKPGITGWAQVNGRNALSWEEKFELDVEYVEKVSAQLDAKIAFVTFEKVVKRQGVNANNYMTMDTFKGTAG